MFRASASRRPKTHLTLHFVHEGKSSKKERKKKGKEKKKKFVPFETHEVYACELGGLASEVRKGKESEERTKGKREREREREPFFRGRIKSRCYREG